MHHEVSGKLFYLKIRLLLRDSFTIALARHIVLTKKHHQIRVWRHLEKAV